MQNPLQQQVDWTKYLGLCWRRKWMILAPVLLFPLAALILVVQIPDQYKSTTLILVQAQKVPTQFVPSTVTTTIEERLNTISQQILSRTRLEEIIQEFDLFAQEKKDKLSPEEIVELMRKRIELKVHRNDAFQLSFVDANPRLAMLVTNKLASLFIEENLRVREQQAIGTSQFLSDEIERVREQVREKENVIYSFKQSHMHELSDQMASNQARLNQLQSQLQINTQNINAAEDRRVTLQQQLAAVERKVQEDLEARKAGGRGTGSLLAELLAEEDGGIDDADLRRIEGEIAKQRKELDRLKLAYTERHPDVLRVAAQVQKLEKEAAREKESLERRKREAAAQAPKEAPKVEARPQYPPAYDQLRTDIARIDAELKRLKGVDKEIERSIELYQRRIAGVAPTELEMKKISEDYENLKATLDNLVAKKLQADLSENLEKKQKGEQFQVLDPANLPEKPFSPKRMRFLAGALGAGMALGFGLVFLLDVLDLSIRSKEELAAVAGIPVVGAIPEIVTPQDLRRRKLIVLGVSGGVAVCLLVAAVVVHVAVKPLPQALGDFVAQARATHWSTME